MYTRNTWLNLLTSLEQFVAVERVIGFRDLPPEAALENDYDNEVKDWPTKGVIDVKDLSVRYRAGLPLSLRGLSFTIDGGSRVGIVGRTGSGKRWEQLMSMSMNMYHLSALSKPTLYEYVSPAHLSRLCWGYWKQSKDK